MVVSREPTRREGFERAGGGFVRGKLGKPGRRPESWGTEVTSGRKVSKGPGGR